MLTAIPIVLKEGYDRQMLWSILLSSGRNLRKEIKAYGYVFLCQTADISTIQRNI